MHHAHANKDCQSSARGSFPPVLPECWDGVDRMDISVPTIFTLRRDLFLHVSPAFLLGYEDGLGKV
jgi:hypothetical protein